MDIIWETVWPIFGLGAGATYCPYTALMWAVWPISCLYIAHTVANIWATKSFLDGLLENNSNFIFFILTALPTRVRQRSPRARPLPLEWQCATCASSRALRASLQSPRKPLRRARALVYIGIPYIRERARAVALARGLEGGPSGLYALSLTCVFLAFFLARASFSSCAGFSFMRVH